MRCAVYSAARHAVAAGLYWGCRGRWGPDVPLLRHGRGFAAGHARRPCSLSLTGIRERAGDRWGTTCDRKRAGSRDNRWVAPPGVVVDCCACPSTSHMPAKKYAVYSAWVQYVYGGWLASGNQGFHLWSASVHAAASDRVSARRQLCRHRAVQARSYHVAE
jgi:hypothetical protein